MNRFFHSMTQLYSALQQNIHKCLYKFQITASNFFTIRQYAFKSFPCSLKFLRRIFCIFCYSAEYKFAEENYDISALEDEYDVDALVSTLSDDEFAAPDAAFSFSGRAIVQTAINKLPAHPKYTASQEKEAVNNISDSKIIFRDKVTWSIGGDKASYYATDLYSKKVTIAYIPDPEKEELFELMELPFPKSVYELYDAMYMIGVRLDAVPVLYIDNKPVYVWDDTAAVGGSNIVNIRVDSSGMGLEYTKELDAGSINSFVFDYQNISSQEVQTRYAEIPSEDTLGSIDAAKIRETDVFKDFLALMGTMYFSEFDIQNKLYSAL